MKSSDPTGSRGTRSTSPRGVRRPEIYPSWSAGLAAGARLGPLRNERARGPARALPGSSVAPVVNVSLVGGVGPRAAAGDEGQDGGPGPEEGEAVDEEAAEHGDQVRRGEDEGPDRGGHRVPHVVAAGGEDDPP